MAPPRKHDSDTILDAALSLALTGGPRSVSVAAIAKESGAPVGTLYHRFGNRDGVLVAAWLRALDRFQQRFLAAAATDADPIETGVAMARSVVAFARACPDDARLLLAVRRDDLFDSPPGDDLRSRIDEMNVPVMAQISELAVAVRGHLDARSLDAVTRAVVDLPYAAVRRHLRRDRLLPRWLERDVSDAASVLLEAAGRRA